MFSTVVHVAAELVTVTALVAVFDPSTVVTVMVAVPAATPVTTPAELTVAIDDALDVQVTFLFVALLGVTVAVKVVVPPTAIDAVVGLTDTPVTATILLVTVIALVAVFDPSAVVTVIVEVPANTPDTTPLVLTVAIAVFDELHITFLLVAVDGNIVAVNCCVPPTAIDALVGLTVTPVTATLLVTGFQR